MKRKQKDAIIAMGIKIAGLEEIVRRHKICLDVYNVRFGDAKIAYNSCMTRLAEHDESLEALNESVEGLGHLSSCGTCSDLLQRVKCLEQIQDKQEANGHDMHDQRIVTLEMQVKNLEGDRHTFLPHKHVGIEEKIASHSNEVATLQAQVKEINARLTALTNKYLERCGNTATAHPPNTPHVNLLTVKKPGRPQKAKK